MPDAMQDAAFAEAVELFRDTLTKDQRKQFDGCSRKEVEKTIAEIQQRLGSSRRQKNMKRLSKFIEGMSQLGQVIELFLNVNVIVAFIWGPMKFFLQTASNVTETFDLLLGTYTEIGETLPGLTQFGTIFRQYPSVGEQLTRYYCDILEFNKSALQVFSRPAWKTIFKSTWKTFESEFRPILASLKLHKQLLSEEKLTALMSEMHEIKSSQEDKFQQLAKALSSKVERDQAKIQAEAEERQREQRRILRSEIRSPDHLQDQEHSFGVYRGGSSDDWIANEAVFRSWSNLSGTRSPLMFLSGIPGAGKTTLVSGVVDHLLKLKKTTDASGSKISVAYFYFKHMHDDKRHLCSMMRSILSQLVDQDPTMLDYVYQKLSKEERLGFDLLKQLTQDAIHAQRLCFLVVDGLDECAKNENTRLTETEKVLEWLKGLGSHDSDVRIFVSGQRDGVLEERLKGYPTLYLENMQWHRDGLEIYAQDQAWEICQKFSSSPVAVESDIVEKVTAASNGMFLYAKVVLDNLLMQTSDSEFEIEMKEGTFPRELEQAYGRVSKRVFKNPGNPEGVTAQKILGWVACANRPLRWREIQSLFCTNAKYGTADMRLLRLSSCKHYCSSLVDVKGSINGINEGRVELVHVSAKQFLIRTGSICLASEHAKMALFSSQYLTSSPFGVQTVDDIRKYALAGYYNLHDYIVTSWWYHTNESLAHMSSCPTDIFSEMVSALSTHLQQHFTAHATQHAAPSSSDQILAHFRKLPSHDKKAREESSSLGQRTHAIREVIETLWMLIPQHLNIKDSIGLRLYGPMHYKCSNSWCNRFEDGFLQYSERDDHINQHLRPFRCPVDDCYATSLGFSSHLQLQQHDKRHHQDSEKPHIFVIERSKEYNDVWAAIAKGDFEAVKAIVQLETERSGFFEFGQKNQNNPRGSWTTPLEYAAECGEFHICEYLLSEGAWPVEKGASPALQAALHRNDADIISLLISGSQSRELVAMMANRTNGFLANVGVEARSRFVNLLKRHHPKLELPSQWLTHALTFDQPDLIKHYFLHEDKANQKKTILHLLEDGSLNLMDRIMGSSEQCIQTLLSYESEEKAMKKIFFEACSKGEHLFSSYLPPMQPKLSEWSDFNSHLSFFERNHASIRSSHPLIRVIERLKPKNVWRILGTTFRFLPLEPWLQEMNGSALREMLSHDDEILFKKDDAGATLLHGFVNANDVEMVKFIASVGAVDLNAAALSPVASSLSSSQSLHILEDFCETLIVDAPESSAHETAKEKISGRHRTMRNDVAAMRRNTKAPAVTPIKMALKSTRLRLSLWNGKAITHMLLDTGRIDISGLSVPDELSLLVDAAKTRDVDVMQAILEKGHSRLCPEVTKDEAQCLMQHLPRISSDLLFIATGGSGAGILRSELSLIKQWEGVEAYPLIDSLKENKNFSLAKQLMARKDETAPLRPVKPEPPKRLQWQQSMALMENKASNRSFRRKPPKRPKIEAFVDLTEDDAFIDLTEEQSFLDLSEEQGFLDLVKPAVSIDLTKTEASKVPTKRKAFIDLT